VYVLSRTCRLCASQYMTCRRVGCAPSCAHARGLPARASCRLTARVAELFPLVCLYAKGLDSLEALVAAAGVHDAVRDRVVAAARQHGVDLGAVKPVAFMVRAQPPAVRSAATSLCPGAPPPPPPHTYTHVPGCIARVLCAVCVVVLAWIGCVCNF
jgi:hypothetical protein